MVVETRKPEVKEELNGATRPNGKNGKRSKFVSLLPFVKSKNGTNGHSKETMEEAKPVIKTPPDLAMAMGLTHLGEDVIHRMDNKAVVVYEVQGLNMEKHAIYAFGAMLNSINHSFQILIRQHAPALRLFRLGVIERTIGNLPGTAAEEAALSFDRYLEALQENGEIIDRHFYVITEEDNAPELESAMNVINLRFERLAGEALKTLCAASAAGVTAEDIDYNYRGSFQRKPNHIEYMGKRRSTLALTSWPRMVQSGYLQSLMLSGLHMDISLHIKPVDTRFASRKLETQQTKMEAARSLSIQKKRDPSSETMVALGDIRKLLDALSRGQERMFDTSMYITVYGRNKAELATSIQAIETYFASSLGKVTPLKYLQMQAMQSVFPKGQDSILHEIKNAFVDTSTLACVFPFSPPAIDRREGSLIGLDLRSRSLVTYDHFTLDNYNIVVLAASGAGKTFFVKSFLYRMMQQGIIAYCVDPEGEYANMARSVGGTVFTPGEEGQGMNPFVVDTSADQSEIVERISSLSQLIQVMVKGGLDANLKSVLDITLTQFYQEADPRDHNFPAFHEFLAEQSSRPSDKRAELAQMLEIYSIGSQRFLLSDSKVDLRQRNEPPMSVYDMHSLPPEMRPLVSMMCAESVWGQAMFNRRKRLMVVDEVWTILMNPVGAEFLLNMSKRARKHLLGLITITQDAQDMLTTDETKGIVGNAGRALIQNSVTKMLLRQDPAVVPSVQAAMNVPWAEARELSSMARGTGMLISTQSNKGAQLNIRIPIQIQATPEETEIIEWNPASRFLAKAARRLA